jgi:hypothetical protein
MVSGIQVPSANQDKEGKLLILSNSIDQKDSAQRHKDRNEIAWRKAVLCVLGV